MAQKKGGAENKRHRLELGISGSHLAGTISGKALQSPWGFTALRDQSIQVIPPTPLLAVRMIPIRLIPYGTFNRAAACAGAKSPGRCRPLDGPVEISRSGRDIPTRRTC
jgi:hypothetical protein